MRSADRTYAERAGIFCNHKGVLGPVGSPTGLTHNDSFSEISGRRQGVEVEYSQPPHWVKQDSSHHS